VQEWVWIIEAEVPRDTQFDVTPMCNGRNIEIAYGGPPRSSRYDERQAIYKRIRDRVNASSHYFFLRTFVGKPRATSGSAEAEAPSELRAEERAQPRGSDRVGRRPRRRRAGAPPRCASGRRSLTAYRR
jgi:hypothetical protein